MIIAQKPKINTQKFIQFLKNDKKFVDAVNEAKAYLKKDPLSQRISTLFIGQDYTGNIRLFTKKPIPYYAVGYGSTYRMWDRTDEDDAGHVFHVGKFDLYETYDTKVIHIRDFSPNDVKKMKFKTMDVAL